MFTQKSFRNDSNNSMMERRRLLIFLASISLGMFLLLLFFKPIGTDVMGFEATLLTILGLSGITFLLLTFCFIVLPALYSEWFASNSSIIALLLFIVLHTVAWSFYLHYVGMVTLSMFIVFKILLLSIGVAVSLWALLAYDRLKALVKQLNLANTILSVKQTVASDEGKEIISLAGGDDHLEIALDQLLYFVSCGNYMEVYYYDGKLVKRYLIRDTMKNTEAGLHHYQHILRCHRSYLVNMHHAIELTEGLRGYKLSLRYLDEALPVSRQYILSIRSWISDHK